MPRRAGCRTWRIVWRCSSVSSGSTARRWPTSSRTGTPVRGSSRCWRIADERAAEVEIALQAAEREYLDLARRLSAERREAATKFAKDLVQVVAGLAMERTRFDVRFNAEPLPAAEWGPRGIDRAEFFVSPNPGEDLRPLARIVSGGELSRLMLAIKTLTARKGRGATLIFDEVDAGIGGHTADVVGRRLQDLAREYQVLCITHLPADRGARRRAVPHQQASPRRQDRHARGAPRHGRPRDGARADDRGRCREQRNAGERRGNAGRTAQGERRREGKRRKRKSPGERTRVSRKYLIETYGCQMNYHDSEQMAGLLEAAGYDRTDDDRDADVVVINTCSVREHAEEKLYTRLGELRVLGEETGRDPHRRRGGLRRAAGRRGAAQAFVAGGRRRRHAPDPDASDAGRAGRDGTPAADRSRRARQRRVPVRPHATCRCGPRVGDDHRGLQRVPAASAWSRTRAATSGCGRRRRSWRRCVRRRSRG